MKHLTFYGGKILVTETPCKYTKKFHKISASALLSIRENTSVGWISEMK
jgi:hypothetical protein